MEVATLHWFGHVERMNEERLTREIYSGNVEGKCEKYGEKDPGSSCFSKLVMS